MNDDSHFLMSLGASHLPGSYYRERCHEIAGRIERQRAALEEIAADDPSGKWGRWAREALTHEQSGDGK